MTASVRARKARKCCWLCAVGVLWSASASAEPVFIGLGNLGGSTPRSFARAVSANGDVVVGGSRSTRGFEAFLWSAETGMVGLGDLPGGDFFSEALDVSADGTVVVGHSYSGAGPFREAFRWSAGQLVGLGDLPGGVFSSGANAVSGDGQVVVGSSASSLGEEAFRWTPQAGLQGLGDLPGGEYESSARGVSGDGSVIVGNSQTDTTSDGEAFLWTPETGMHALDGVPVDVSSSARAVSANGRVIAGSSKGFQGFLWSEEAGLVSLGNVIIQDLSADGTKGVGFLHTASGNIGIVWDQRDGVRVLEDLLVNGLGLDLDGWAIGGASDISADGMVIVGTGTNPLGNTEAWLAVIPEPVTLVLLGFGIAVMAARRRSRTA